MPRSEAVHKNCRSAAKRRRNAAQQYQPELIRLLIVAQMPPDALDRYFYFQTVDKADYLFRAVVPHLLGEEPARLDKRAQLTALQRKGVFVIDLKPDPCNPEPLSSFVDDLADRAVGHQPKAAILVKVDVYDAAFLRLRDAGVNVVDARLPFPSTGRQNEFATGFRAALAAAGLQSRAPEGALRG